MFIPLNRLKVNLHCDNRDLDDVPNTMKARAELFHLYLFWSINFYEILHFYSMNLSFIPYQYVLHLLMRIIYHSIHTLGINIYSSRYVGIMAFSNIQYVPSKAIMFFLHKQEDQQGHSLIIYWYIM